MFGRRSFTAPQGLVAHKRKLEMSLPFVFDPDQKPAVRVNDMFRKQHVSLVKSYDAAGNALGEALRGLRMNVIVILDGSGSMSSDYRSGEVQRMLTRTLGFAMQVDADGSIPVITYGYDVARAVDINVNNYQQAGQLVRPDFGTTNMARAFQVALEMAKHNKIPTMIFNITDGNPDSKVATSNIVIDTASYPIFVKNLAIRPVQYLADIDDLPSQFEIRKDNNDNPVKDAQDFLLIDPNPQGIRLIDNVDSKAFDPSQVTDEFFAQALADEVGTWLEVAARVGILTGVPGVSRTF